MFFNRRWPPVPPPATLLGGDTDPMITDCLSRPRESWAAGDWRLYAEYLEREGHRLAKELAAAQSEAFKSRAKLNRRKGVSYIEKLIGGSGVSLLGAGLPTKRGRPPAIETRAKAREAVAILLEMRGRDPRATKKDALAAWYRQRGRRSDRANTDTGTLREMSRVLGNKSKT